MSKENESTVLTFLGLGNVKLVVDDKLDGLAELARKAISTSYEVVNEPRLEALEAELSKAKRDPKLGRTNPKTIEIAETLEDLTNAFIVVVGNEDELPTIPTNLLAEVIESHELATGKTTDPDDVEGVKAMVATYKTFSNEIKKQRIAMYENAIAYRDLVAKVDANANVGDHKKSVTSVENSDDWNAIGEFMASKDYPNGAKEFSAIAEFIHDCVNGKKSSTGTGGSKPSYNYLYDGFAEFNEGSNVTRVGKLLMKQGCPEFEVKETPKFIIMAKLKEGWDFKAKGYSAAGLKAKINSKLNSMNSKVRVPNGQGIEKTTQVVISI